MADRATEDLIDKNRMYAGLLGWNPTDVGALSFDPLLIAMIRAQQALLGTDEDGLMGPTTYKLLLAEKLAYVARHPRRASSQMTAEQAAAFNFADAQQMAVWEMKLLWLEKIEDLPSPASADFERCRKRIDDLIRTDIGIGWAWEEPYGPIDPKTKKPIQNFEWCGTAPAYGYRKRVPLVLRQKWFASTYRLDRFARYQQMDLVPNPRPAQGPYRMILSLDESSTTADCVFEDGTKPRAGDIALVGGKNTGPGKHITLVEQFIETQNGASIITLENNGTGYWPDGSRKHGIVRATRHVGLPANLPSTTYFVRRFIRLAPADLSLPA